MLKPLFTSLLACIGLCMTTQARPVSYQHGWTIMMNRDRTKQSLLVHYSPTHYYSIGYRVEQRNKQHFKFSALQINNLLRRWNLPRAQANLYLQSGWGLARCTNSEKCTHSDSSVQFTGLSYDWENQRYYFSYSNQYLKATSFTREYSDTIRIGVTPYIGKYNQLHTWIMLQLDHHPQQDHHYTFTPLLRFFKGTNLFEIGASKHNEVYLTWINLIA